MRIFITTMDEPLYTNSFIKRILDKCHNEIIGIAVSKGNPLTTRSLKQYVESIVAMFIIMGIPHFLKHFVMTVSFRLSKHVNRFLPFVRSSSILAYAKKSNIPCYDVKSVNGVMLLKIMRSAKPDVVINQAQEILRDEFLSIPKIGCLNRHNSLLPRHRGRFSPFWVLYNEEAETGVTIHFVTSRIDAGEIVVQKRIAVHPRDTFLTLTQKCYDNAGTAMIEALDILDKKQTTYKFKQIKQKGNYNSLPTIRNAMRYHGILQRRKRTHYA
jgi:methionyl-tRNA formyltransferase